MTVSVALYERALERIGDELRALDLDIDIHTFDKDGRFHSKGSTIAAEDIELDYLWLSPDISMEGIQAPIFKMVLDCKSLGILQTFNAGLDHPVYGKAAAKGTRICNSSAQAVAISEFVIAHVLGLFHPLAERRTLQDHKEWKRTPFQEIARTNWLIAGFGPIGQGVARLAKAFGASTNVIRRSPATSEIVDRAGTLADIGHFAADADVIVLACPLNAQTSGMADAAFFGQVKEGAVLVNIARGGLVDDAALIAALDSGRLSAAVLDVFHEEPLPQSDPLWAHPKVTLTAHTSFGGSGVRRRWDELFLDNVARFARGEQLQNEVNPADLK